MGYVVVDSEGNAIVWGRSEILRSRKEANECADQANSEEGSKVYRVMEEMDWYRVYHSATYLWIVKSREKAAVAKVQRQIERAAKKEAEAKKLAAAKAYWADDRNFAQVKNWWE